MSLEAADYVVYFLKQSSSLKATETSPNKKFSPLLSLSARSSFWRSFKVARKGKDSQAERTRGFLSNMAKERKFEDSQVFLQPQMSETADALKLSDDIEVMEKSRLI